MCSPSVPAEGKKKLARKYLSHFLQRKFVDKITHCVGTTAVYLVQLGEKFLNSDVQQYVSELGRKKNTLNKIVR